MEEGKLFIILLVFASLAQSSRVPTFRRGYYGLPDKQVAILNKQLANQNAAVTAYKNALKGFFEVLSDLNAKSDEDYSKVWTSIVGMKDAVDPFFDSVLITVEGSSSAVKVAQEASYKYLRNAAGEVQAAFKLAQPGNYQNNRVAIRVHRTTARQNFENWVKTFYCSISTSVDIKNVDVLGVIKTAKIESLLSLARMINAIFDAIDTWAAAASAGDAEENFVSNIEDLEDRATLEAKTDVEYKFSTISTIYIYPFLNKEGILPKLAKIQYALIATHINYKDGDDVIFNAIRRHLERIRLGLNPDFSQNDADSAALVRNYYRGDSITQASYLLLRPNRSSENAAALKTIYALDSQGANNFFATVRAAGLNSNYSQVLDIIKTTRATVNSFAQSFTKPYISTLRANDPTSDPELETKLTTLMNELTTETESPLNADFDAVVILARATHAGKVSDDDFSGVEIQRDISNGYFEFCETASIAGLSVLLSKN